MWIQFYDFFEVRKLREASGVRKRNVGVRIADEIFVPESAEFSFNNGHYAWRKTRVLERRDTTPEEEGVHLINFYRCCRRFGLPPSSTNLSGVDESLWPPEIDRLARPRRLHHYYRLFGSKEAASFLMRTFEPSLRFSEEIRVSLAVNEAWYEPTNGNIEIRPVDDPPANVHAVPINIYNIDSFGKEHFVFQNSWGEWGIKGHGALTPQAYDHYVLAAWRLEGHGFFPDLSGHAGVVSLLWKAMPGGDSSRAVYGVEIVDCDTDERIGWAFARNRERFFELEEFFVWPDSRNLGYGKVLASLIHELASDCQKPLRVTCPRLVNQSLS